MHNSSRSFEDALKLCVEALGGPQIVGHRMRPEMNPIAAGIWLGHCLNEHHAQKASPAQLAWILREAKAAGAHAGFEAIAATLGYRVTAVIDEREAVADLARQAKQAADTASALSTEMLARAHALHLKVEG